METTPNTIVKKTNIKIFDVAFFNYAHIKKKKKKIIGSEVCIF